jgi:hypothetical protein
MAESNQQETPTEPPFLSVVRSVILTGIGVFFNVPDFFQEEAELATPRRVAITLFTVSVIGVLVGTIVAFLAYSVIQATIYIMQPNGTAGVLILLAPPPAAGIFGLIVRMVFQTLLTAVALLGGCRLSHWWIGRRGGSAELLSHSQVILIAWLPLQLFTAISLTIGLKLLEANLLLLLRREELLLRSTEWLRVGFAVLLLVVSLGLFVYGFVLISRALRAIYDLDSRIIRNGALIALLAPLVLDAILSLDWLTTLRLLLTL